MYPGSASVSASAVSSISAWHGQRAQLGKGPKIILSRLLALLDRNLDESPSMSWRSCARGVALSTLYRMGWTSVDSGGGAGNPNGLACLRVSTDTLSRDVGGEFTFSEFPTTASDFLSSFGEVFSLGGSGFSVEVYFWSVGILHAAPICGTYPAVEAFGGVNDRHCLFAIALSQLV